MALPIRWAPRAARQMEELLEYIAADSPRYAAIFAKRIVQVIRAVPANPEMGRIVPEYGDRNIREKVPQGYRIVYRITPHVVEIAAIRHGSRLIKNALDDPSE